VGASFVLKSSLKDLIIKRGEVPAGRVIRNIPLENHTKFIRITRTKICLVRFVKKETKGRKKEEKLGMTTLPWLLEEEGRFGGDGVR